MAEDTNYDTNLVLGNIDYRKVAFLTILGYSLFAICLMAGSAFFMQYMSLLKEREAMEISVAMRQN